jgi:hypothetical protein
VFLNDICSPLITRVLHGRLIPLTVVVSISYKWSNYSNCSPPTGGTGLNSGCAQSAFVNTVAT